LLFAHGAVSLIIVGLLVFTQKCPWLIGKDRDEGSIPWWSWVQWWSFHGTNRLFALIAKHHKGVETATEVYPGFYVGGWFSYELGVEWDAVVDLCCELPKRCKAKKYLCCPQWDGVTTCEDVAVAASLLVEESKKAGKGGKVLVHCAHGVGRSTTVMRAALVEAGFFKDTDESFAHIKSKRKVVKDNPRFQKVLAQWAEQRPLLRKRNQ